MNHLIEQGVSLIIPVYNEAQSLPFSAGTGAVSSTD